MLSALLNDAEGEGKLPFTKFIATVGSQASKTKLEQRFSQQHAAQLSVSTGERNAEAVQSSDVVILGVDPSQVAKVLSPPEIRHALSAKLLISVATGWTNEKLRAASILTERHSSIGRLLRFFPGGAFLQDA